MPIAKNEDLHGNAPEKSPVVLLIIDVISDFQFPGGDELLANAEKVAENIAALRKRADQAKIPIVYVNDNFGKWQSDFKTLLNHCLEKKSKGRKVAEMLKPRQKDYFVLKPKHSGFYSTTLELLLQYLGAKTLIITGLTADICVLFTAADAFLRDYNVKVPSDCTTSRDRTDLENALKYIERVLHADMRPSSEIKF